MARRKPDYKPVGYLNQIARIIDATAPPVVLEEERAEFIEWLIPLLKPLLEQLIAGWIESCENRSATRVSKIAGRLGIVRQIRYVNELIREARKEKNGGRLTRADARRVLLVAVGDAKANPKDTEASILELRG